MGAVPIRGMSYFSRTWKHHGCPGDLTIGEFSRKNACESKKRSLIEPAIPLGEAPPAAPLGFQVVLELCGDLDQFGIVSDPADRRVNDGTRQFYDGKELLAVLTIGCNQSSALLVLSGVIASGDLVKDAEYGFQNGAHPGHRADNHKIIAADMSHKSLRGVQP